MENTNLLLHFVSDPSGNNAGLDFTVTLVPHELTLANDDSTKPEGSKNADIISDAAEKHKVCNVTLSNRTLLKDGNWNTLCLPFDVTIAASPLAGDNVEAKVFDNTSSLSDTGELTLKFTAAPATIPAGTPFIIKWDNTGVNLETPVFNGVIISSTAALEIESTDGNVRFTGQYSPFCITDENINEILYIASGNKIGYSSKVRTLKSCRAHFWVKPNGTQQAARIINIDFGDGETTSLGEVLRVESEDFATDSEWYTLDGRKLDKQPIAKGVYIHNGRKTVIK